MYSQPPEHTPVLDSVLGAPYPRTVFYLHGTKKLLDRIKPELSPPGYGDTLLGNWYATAIFSKPQIALLVAEQTLLPVLMPLAPAATLARRFPPQLALVLKALGVPADFVAQEIWQMGEVRYARTASRSVVGIMNEFVKQAEFWLTIGERESGEDHNLIDMSVKLAETPCSPLYKGAVSPDRALRAVVDEGATA